MTSAVLRWTAEQLKRGEPPWWKPIAAAWDKRRFVAWTEAWGVYLAALHYEALSDAECPLVPYFPSCGGTAEAEPATGLARFLAAPPSSFFDNLRLRHRRTYIAARAPLWMSPAMLFFQRKRRLPYYLLEVNAGAGLDLAADAIFKTKGFDSGLVAARIGLDPEPLDTADIGQRRWLTAGAWPDLTPAIAELDFAIDTVQKACAREASFLQLAACPPEKAPAFVAKNIPSDDPGVGLLVFNMATTSRMTDAEYAAYGEAMAAALSPWSSRALWVEAEHVRGEAFSTTLQLRATRYDGPAPSTAVLASVDFEARAHSHDDALAQKFLAVP